MANKDTVHVRSNEELYKILDTVVEHLDEIKSDRTALETRTDKMNTEVQAAIADLKEQQAKWEATKARLDALDKALPVGEKVYLPADGSAAKTAVRKDIARFMLDGMSYAMHRQTPFQSVEFKRALDDLGQSFKNDGSDNVGGYLVPDEFRQEILRTAQSFGLVRKLFRRIPMQGYILHMPTHVSGPEVEWVGDASSALTGSGLPTTGEGSGPSDSTQAKFDRVSLRSSRLMAVDTLSMEITEWAVPIIQDFLVDVFAEKLAEAEDKAGLIGDGTSTYGGFTGVVGATGVKLGYIGGAGATGSNQSFADIRYADLVNVVDAPNEFASENGQWVMSNSIMNLLRKLREDEGAQTGRPLWSEFGTEMQSGVPATILGRPINRSAVMNKQSTQSQAGKAVMVYGNFRNAIMGESMNLQIAFSEHADFKKGNIVMRVMERVGFLTTLGDTFAVLKAQVP